MLSRTTRHLLTGLIATAGLLVTGGGTAMAAAAPASATISACQLDRMTVAGKVKLSGRGARKARGAKLQVRFRALPLFGLPRSGEWRDLGKKVFGSAQEAFSGLGADNWVGAVSWRFKRGSRTLLSGTARSQPVKIGAAKGRANCTISEGLKPLDTTPPALYILPAPDDVWHRAPKPLQLIAQDDFSGVQSLRYAVDGGAMQAIGNGGIVSLDTEGSHRLDWAATDVAGNTGTRSAVIRVDAGPPSKPSITGPKSVTAAPTPTITWTASTDSASGLRGYVIEINKSDGSSVAVQTVNADTTSITAPQLPDDTTYVARVTAVDNTDQPWASSSDPYTFRVDSTPQVTGITPEDRTILSGDLKNTNFTLTLDRPADPATRSATLDNIDDNSGPIPATVGCTSTPCTSIVLDPSSSLAEGRYTVTLGAVKSDEGVAFQAFTARYSVPFDIPNRVDVGAGLCGIDQYKTSQTPAMISAPTTQEAGVLKFNWSGGDNWRVRILAGTTPLAPTFTKAPDTPNPAQIEFTIPAGTNTITFEFGSECTGGNAPAFRADNLLAWRVP